jgi:subtilisin family serine protease
LQRLVVGSFEEQGVAPGLGDIVADLVTQSIDSSKVELVERRQVKRVIEEQLVASSDLTEPGAAARYGKLADSRFVLLGSVYRVEGVYYVSIRIVDIETGVVREGSRTTATFRTVDEMVAQVPGLVRAIGLCDNCPSTPPALQARTQPAHEAGTLSTVQDYLEQPGDRSGHVELSLLGGRQVPVGRELQIQVRSPRAGYLSLFVVDAWGTVSLLVPNSAVLALQVQPGKAIIVPSDAGFKLLASAPLGMTRVKAIVSRDPLPLVGSPDAAGLLRRVTLDQQVASVRPNTSSADVSPEQAWIGGEFEFLVVSEDGTLPVQPARAPRADPIQVIHAPEAVLAAFERVSRDAASVAPEDARTLQWPLRNPFAGGVDVSQSMTPKDAASGPCIAVIDADFDPDDPVLARAFRNLETGTKELLRDEIRRNGAAAFRHGNRVASLIAGDAAWLPSAAPGAEIRPIRVTTAIEGPSYRVDRGRATELLDALRAARRAGCQIVNLSLSLPLQGAELRAFASDPIWDELEREGVLVVCAAGNFGQDLDTAPTYPACLGRSNILCVGAVGPDGRVAKWEGGGSAFGASSVDVMAPGVLLAASDGSGLLTLAQGTSYASAIASGVAAQWLQREPNLTGPQLIRLLLDTAERHPDLSGLCRSGIIRCPR